MHVIKKKDSQARIGGGVSFTFLMHSNTHVVVRKPERKGHIPWHKEATRLLSVCFLFLSF